MEKIPMTRAGHTALETELKHLKSVERPAIIKAIAEAREHGDLSENAEYHSAKEKQSFIEGRIKELEGVISLADVIDPAKMSGAIKFGATVTLVDEDTDEEKTYQIVGEYEANIEKGLLNIKSPIARALIGKDAVNRAIDSTRDFVNSTYAPAAKVAARGGTLKEAWDAVRAECDPKFGDYAIYEHCLPFNVARAFDEARGIDTPRIWTAERDIDMWNALQE